MKERLTSLDLRKLLPELNQYLQSKVEQIYQPKPKEIHLHLYHPKAILVIKSGQAIYLTKTKPQYPKRPHGFCMLLRKHLNGFNLVKIEQKDFDRILELTFQREENKKLIIELFGKGNVILCQGRQIIQPLTFQRARKIKSKVEYQYPPKTGENFFELDLKGFRKCIKTKKEIVRFLATNLAFGGLYAEEICHRANLNKHIKGKDLTPQQIKELYDQILGLLIEDRASVYLKNDFPYAFAPFRLKSLIGYELKEFDQFDQSISHYFSKLEQWRVQEAKKERIERELKRLERIKINQKETIQRSREWLKQYKQYADELKKNLGQIKSLVSRLQRAKDSMSWKEIEERYQIKHEPPKKIILKGIPIDLTKSVSNQMEWYYKRYKKFKKKLKGAKQALQRTEEKIREIKEGIREVKRTKKPKKEWYERFHWFLTSQGFLVIGGRTAEQNEELISKYTEKEDIVFHATIQSPFCVIKTKGKEVEEKSLKETAKFCASYSRAWKRGLSAIDVFWVKPDQLKPHPKRGAFRVKGKRNFYRSVPLEIAIGFKDKIKIIGGPVSAVKKQTKCYVTLKPGYEMVRELAKGVRDKLEKKVSKRLREKVAKIDLDEICKFTPGEGQIADFH